MMILVSTFFFVATEQIFSVEQTPPPFSLIIDNSTKQEIVASAQKKAAVCKLMHKGDRLSCLLETSPDELWEQFTSCTPEQRVTFINSLSLSHHQLFLERITPERWDPWFYSLPQDQRHALKGNHAYYQKMVQDARARGSNIARYLAQPALFLALLVLTPDGAIILGASQFLMRCTHAKDPIEQRIQETVFERYKKK